MKNQPEKQPKIKGKDVARPGQAECKGPVIRTSLKTRGKGIKVSGRRDETEIDILSQIKDAVICLDQQEMVFCWNHAAESLYGVKAEDALGRKRRELFRNEWIEPIDESDAKQSLQKSGFWQGENIHILNNGVSIYVESSISLLKGKNNKTIGTLVVIRDITARKKAEHDRENLLKQIEKQQQRIEESLWTIERERERYQLIFENAFEGILLADPDSNVTLVNPRMAQMLGYQIDELYGRKFGELIASDELPGMEVRRAQRREGIIEQYDLKMVKKDGSVIWTMNHAVPLFDKEKKFVGYLGIFADISDRKQAELEKETILRTAMDGFWMIDRQGRFLDVNDAYCKVIGYSRDELLKMSVRDVEAQESESDIARRIEKLVETDAERFETKHRCKDGRIVDIEVSANYFDVQGGCLFVFLRDISRRKSMEAELVHLASFPERNPMPVVEMSLSGEITYMNRSARQTFPTISDLGRNHPFLKGVEELVDGQGDETQILSREVQIGGSWYEETVYYDKANGNFRFYGRDITGRKRIDQMKDDFIGMVSHEMRTPLTVIVGGLNTLSQDAAKLSSKERRQLLEDAIVESDELSHILDNLLELSRSQADRLKIATRTVELSELAQKVIDKFRKQNDHRFILNFAGGLPVIDADPLRIERVIFNLVQNAVKYSPGGGPIELSADRMDGFVKVGIKDYGMGISEREQGLLFNPFQRIDKEKDDMTRGVGLGLVVCKRLVEAHGGQIWLESEIGRGTTVFFTLPVKPAAR